jgi:alkaline phosphatase D
LPPVGRCSAKLRSAGSARAGVTVGGRRRFSSDKWDGYPAARDRLLEAIVDNGPRSCVVLSGDEHTAFVADLKRDFDDGQAPPIATEFCGTSITTSGRMQSATEAIVRENPHIVYGESARRGYVVFDVTAALCTARLRMIEDVTDRHTGVMTAATFAIDAGRPGVRKLEV